MKQQQRSTIAIMAAGLLGGAGVGVAAAHLAQPTQAAQSEAALPVVTSPVSPATTSTLAARIHDLIAGTEMMNRRLVASRLDLARQLRELGRLRERAASHETALTPGSAVSVVSPPAVTPAPPAPPPAAHTTTGASGAAGSGDDDGDDNEKEHDDD